MFQRKIFANKLKQLRTKRDVSMAALSTMLGLSKGAVSQFEKGSNLPSIDTLFAMADFFEVSLDELLGFGYHKLLENPTGVLPYNIIVSDNTAAEGAVFISGTINYVFGVFPLEHLTSIFLYLEETEGDLLKRVCLPSDNSQVRHDQFLRLRDMIYYNLNLGYKEISEINLIIKVEDTPLPRYKEINGGALTPVTLQDIFSGYEHFIRDYLAMPADKKAEFLKAWADDPVSGISFLDRLNGYIRKLLD